MSDSKLKLDEEIQYWAPKIKDDDSFLEIAFFKIFVKFENFVTESIIKYATGEIENDEKVKRRILFDDTEHFKKVTNLPFLDTSNKTKELVSQIFQNDNRFSVFFDSEDSTFFEHMKFLRNYIAHESYESKTKYINKTLHGANVNTDDKGVISPNEFLKYREKHQVNSEYTRFIELVTKYSEYLDYDN